MMRVKWVYVRINNTNICKKIHLINSKQVDFSFKSFLLINGHFGERQCNKCYYKMHANVLK